MSLACCWRTLVAAIISGTQLILMKTRIKINKKGKLK
jgi:hypothetical protein